MSEELERIGLEAVFILDDFLPKADKYKNSLAAINKATYDATNRMAKAAVSAKDVDDKVAGFADRLDDVAGAAKLYNERLTEMYRRKEAVKAQTTVFVDALHKEGRSFEEIANAMGVSQTQLLQVFKDQGWSLEEMASATGLTTQKIQEMTAAQEKQAQSTNKVTSYIGQYLKRLALWVTVGAAVRGIIRGITTNLKEGFKALYENTEEYKNLTESSDRFRNSLVLSIAPMEKTLELMSKLADAQNKWADAMERHVARRGTQIEAIQQVAQRDLLNQTPGMAEEDRMAVAQMMYQTAQGVGLTEEQIRLLDEISKKYEWNIDVLETYNQKLQENKDATTGAADAEKKMADATEEFAAILQSADEELARHAQAVSLIHGAYDDEAAGIVIDFWNNVEQITREKNAEIEQINAEYADRIEAASANGLRRIRELQERARRQDRNDEERHQLQMQFARRRFELSQIQNERMYQARRRRLVGEGDVLAIEELDEQYELQKQAAEENFKLQMQQAEAMYRLQARIQEESMAAQINMLRQAMNEQIAELEAAKRKEIEAAEAAAAKELEIAEQKRDQDLIDAKDARDQQLADEAEAHAKRIEAIAQQINDFANKYDIEMSLLDGVIESHWGKGSAMDVAVEQYFARMVAYATEAASYVQRLMSGVGYFGGGGGFGINFGGGRPGAGRQAGTTGGRSEIYSTPTLIPVAEGGRSESVSVQPTYPTGSMAMSLSWTGGPIEVRGSGSLSGADLSGLASGIAIAITSRTKQAYRDMYAPGG